MPVQITCRQCSAPMTVPPSRVGRRQFCARSCYAAWMSENMTGEKALRYGKGHTPESKAQMSATKRQTAHRGAASWNWNGGRHISRGYVMVNAVTLDPEERVRLASMISSDSVAEHRLVMARIVGRPLRSDEQVHHVNGIKTDNRPENLELHDQETHSREHARIAKEMRRLQEENHRLRLALSNCSCATSPADGSTTSN